MGFRSYDIAIIGGGIIGLATAMRLSQEYPRRKVAVLEEGAGRLGGKDDAFVFVNKRCPERPEFVGGKIANSRKAGPPVLVQLGLQGKIDFLAAAKFTVRLLFDKDVIGVYTECRYAGVKRDFVPFRREVV